MKFQTIKGAMLALFIAAFAFVAPGCGDDDKSKDTLFTGNLNGLSFVNGVALVAVVTQDIDAQFLLLPNGDVTAGFWVPKGDRSHIINFGTTQTINLEEAMQFRKVGTYQVIPTPQGNRFWIRAAGEWKKQKIIGYTTYLEVVETQFRVDGNNKAIVNDPTIRGFFNVHQVEAYNGNIRVPTFNLIASVDYLTFAIPSIPTMQQAYSFEI